MTYGLPNRRHEVKHVNQMDKSPHETAWLKGQIDKFVSTDGSPPNKSQTKVQKTQKKNLLQIYRVYT